MNESTLAPALKVGDRVTRPRSLDDGTWARKGDACLPGPLMHGTVVAVEQEPPRNDLYARTWTYRVTWDEWPDAPRGGYLARGLEIDP